MEENSNYSTVAPTKPPGATVPVGSWENGYALPVCRRTEAAARLLAGGAVSEFNKKLTAAEAMRISGFTEEERANKALQRRVLRLRTKYTKETIPTSVLPNKEPAPAISPVASAVSPLVATKGESGKSISRNSCKSQNKSSTTTPSSNSRSGSKRTKDVDDADDADVKRARSETEEEEEEPKGLKKRRRSSSQLVYDMTMKQKQKDRSEESYLGAAKIYKEQPGSKRISLKEACDMVNRMNGTDIKMNTLKWRLTQGNKGLSTGRRGRPSTIPVEVEEALVTAIETSFLLCSDETKQKPNRKKGVEDLKACLSRGPCSLKDFSGLYRRLQPRFAHSVQVNKSNSQLMILRNGDIDEAKDPATVELLDLERRNAIAVETLINFGFDGEVFRMEAPRNPQRVTRSEATTARQIQGAIAKSNTAGKKYILLGEEQYSPGAFSRREEEIKAMESAKARAEEYARKETNCKALIESCSGDFAKLRVNEMKKIYEWKLGKKATGLKTEEILGALVETKENPPVGAVYWTAEDDAALGKKIADHFMSAINILKNITNEMVEIIREHLSPEEIKMLEKWRAQWPCEE